jgi:hypothetical protein
MLQPVLMILSVLSLTHGQSHGGEGSWSTTFHVLYFSGKQGIIADLIAALTYLDKRCISNFSSPLSLETPSSDVENRWKVYEVAFDSFEYSHLCKAGPQIWRYWSHSHVAIDPDLSMFAFVWETCSTSQFLRPGSYRSSLRGISSLEDTASIQGMYKESTKFTRNDR